jgi:hypothetical protein
MYLTLNDRHKEREAGCDDIVELPFFKAWVGESLSTSSTKSCPVGSCLETIRNLF